MAEMHSKIVGISFTDDDYELSSRQDNVRDLKKGHELTLEFEDDNPFDPSAIKLFADKDKKIPLGYLKKELARDLRLQMEKGWSYTAKVEAVTGQEKQSKGCNIIISASKSSNSNNGDESRVNWDVGRERLKNGG
ncbi:hypothetical protein GOV11_04840 [Candidatus Woesearchaeota archaeon]|nr:hypothetical protein [Candidatus Woesearchaeota archaeon]